MEIVRLTRRLIFAYAVFLMFFEALFFPLSAYVSQIKLVFSVEVHVKVFFVTNT